MASMTYLETVAILAEGGTIRYADLDTPSKQHVRSLTAERFAEAHAGNGRKVLLSHPSAHIRLTSAGTAYAASLRDAGVILAPLAVPTPPKPAASGRHAKPENTVYADVDTRIAAREQAVKPAARGKRAKASKVTTTKVAPKVVAPRMVLAPQDLEALRKIASMLPSIDSFTDQFHK